jgi:hypothetical protein
MLIQRQNSYIIDTSVEETAKAIILKKNEGGN